MREFINGNQAVVRGALKAGCDFFAGYPITPANAILSEMVHAFSDGSGIAIQTEDEIAAIGQCIGASMAGAKPLTASSGPGLSLYSENIGLAQMGEVPLVIVNVQRMGPATGGATYTGEGDVLFAGHVTAGGYPIPVLAATNAETAYRLTHKAFNIAETLRTPVIVLSSKDIAMPRQTADLEAIPLPEAVTRRASRDENFAPYDFKSTDDVPAFAPIGGERRVRFTGSIHDADGLLTTDRKKIVRKLQHLRDRILSHIDVIEDTDSDVDNEAQLLIVCYGQADGAAREAVSELRRAGYRVSRVTLYSLWPVATKTLQQALTPQLAAVVVPELNIGLYTPEIKKVIPQLPVESITRFDGGLISPESIVDCARDHMKGRVGA